VSTRDDAIVLAFPESRAQAARFARHAGLALAEIDVHRFPDGESLLRLPPTLPPSAILFRSLDRPNGKLVELELAAATAMTLGAQTLTLVAPYLCYMRQDKAFHPGEAVSQHIVGAMLARYFDRLITVDPHLHRTPRLASAVPVRSALALSAAPLMARWLAEAPDRPLLLGPDEESAQWVSAIAEKAGLDYGVARKVRLGDREVRIALPEEDYAGRSVTLIDDVASTGRTLVEAARRLQERGVGTLRVLVTHALFVDDAVAQLEAAGVSEILSSDSIPHPSNRLELAQLLATALQDD
jgi:ribose-phosphate pyrophosphokinase